MALATPAKTITSKGFKGGDLGGTDAHEIALLIPEVKCRRHKLEDNAPAGGLGQMTSGTTRLLGGLSETSS